MLQPLTQPEERPAHSESTPTPTTTPSEGNNYLENNTPSEGNNDLDTNIPSEEESAPSEPISSEPISSEPAKDTTPSKPTAPPLTREQLDAMWEEECAKAEMLLECESYAVDLTKEYVEPIPVIELDGTVIASEGNLSAIVGEAKSKKTFLCSAIVGDMLRIKRDRRFGINRHLCQVLWVDTEQSELHARKVARRVLDLCQSPVPDQSPFFKMLTLREFDPIKRKDVLYKAIKVYRPKLVVIDGISDLQHNTNDLEESESIVTTLMALSTIHNCHIMCVLHTNPGSDKARGHTGSALQRKAETVLYVRKIGEVSVVEPQFCRNEPFERFAFRVNDEGLPEQCDLPNEGGGDQNDVVKVMREYFPDGVSRTTLTNKMIEVLACTPNCARVKISRAVRRGLLEDSDGDVFLR